MSKTLRVKIGCGEGSVNKEWILEDDSEPTLRLARFAAARWVSEWLERHFGSPAHAECKDYDNGV